MLFRAAKVKASCEEVQKDLLVLSNWTVKHMLLNHGRRTNDSLMALN